jgi:hypothetical protein
VGAVKIVCRLASGIVLYSCGYQYWSKAVLRQGDESVLSVENVHYFLSVSGLEASKICFRRVCRVSRCLHIAQSVVFHVVCISLSLSCFTLFAYRSVCRVSRCLHTAQSVVFHVICISLSLSCFTLFAYRSVSVVSLINQPICLGFQARMLVLSTIWWPGSNRPVCPTHFLPLPHFSICLNQLSNPEDGGSMFLQNIITFNQYLVLKRQPSFQQQQPWKPENLQADIFCGIWL